MPTQQRLMLVPTRRLLLALVALTFTNVQAEGQTLPGIGWEASLSNDFHDVSGTVSVLDSDTLQFDAFTYDGGGLAVFFYLGASDTTTDFANGLPIGQNFLGSVFDGTQPAFTLDLPAGTTIEGYQAISVWCTAVGVSFGSGTFLPPVPVPEPASLSTILAAAVMAMAMFQRT